MQNVESKPCDIEGCNERSTSYSSGHGRWCDKHSPLPNFNPDLKGRRKAVKRRIEDILTDSIVPDIGTELMPDEIAEKILQELKL